MYEIVRHSVRSTNLVRGVFFCRAQAGCGRFELGLGFIVASVEKCCAGPEELEEESEDIVDANRLCVDVLSDEFSAFALRLWAV